MDSTVTFESTWEVSKAEIFKDLFLSLQSPIFHNNQNEETKWRLNVHRRIDADKGDEFFSFFLNLENSLPEKTKAKFKLSLLNKRQEKVLPKESPVENIHGRELCYSFFDFFGKKYINNNSSDLLFDGNLKISCEITLFGDSKDKNNSQNPTPVLDTSKLLFSHQYSDFTITVDGVDLKAHKMVLSLRSPVFDAMFNSNIQESQSNRVEIKDFGINVVREMLTYIYTNTCPKIKELALELMMIADKYGINDLKKIADEQLYQSLCEGNACDYLIVAHTYSNSRLKDFCLDFIVLNAQNIVKKKNWREFVVKYPPLLESLLKRALKIG
uniref:BTB domain-containing protein n=1 Tax=Strongyloides papillosus TaxID=174720 RepID=A0A0N5BST2_STREA